MNGKPGVLAVIDELCALLPPENRASEAFCRGREARATVERLAEDAQVALDFFDKRLDAARRDRAYAEWDPKHQPSSAEARKREALRAALAEFRGEQA